MDNDMKRYGIGFVLGLVIGFIYLIFLLINGKIISIINSILKNTEIWSLDIFRILYLSLKGIFITPFLTFTGIVLFVFIVLFLIKEKFFKESKLAQLLVGCISGVAISTVLIVGFTVPIVLIISIPIIIWMFSLPISILVLPVFNKLYNATNFFMNKILAINIIFSPNWDVESIKLYYRFLTFSIILPYAFNGLAKVFMIVIERSSGKEFVNYFLKLLKLISVDFIRLVVYFFLFVLYTMANVFSVGSNAEIIKEALLAYILIDTVIYQIYKQHKLKKYKLQKEVMMSFSREIDRRIDFIVFNNLVGNRNIKSVKLVPMKSFDELSEKLKNDYVTDLIYKKYLMVTKERILPNDFLKALQSISEITKKF